MQPLRNCLSRHPNGNWNHFLVPNFTLFLPNRTRKNWKNRTRKEWKYRILAKPKNRMMTWILDIVQKTDSTQLHWRGLNLWKNLNLIFFQFWALVKMRFENSIQNLKTQCKRPSKMLQNIKMLQKIICRKIAKKVSNVKLASADFIMNMH